MVMKSCNHEGFGKMIARTRTLEQIRLIGLEALSRELGPVGMIRFLQQFETGHGDYSNERHQWLDQLSIKEFIDQVEQRRKAG
jgi:hypothetical protein